MTCKNRVAASWPYVSLIAEIRRGLWRATRAGGSGPRLVVSKFESRWRELGRPSGHPSPRWFQLSPSRLLIAH